MGHRTDLIRRHEEFGLSAFPALSTVYDDGWVLRFAEGYTRRSNSVNPIYPSSGDLSEKIERCAALYRTQGVRMVFKMTDAVLPSDLDAQLAQHGFEAEGRTSVQTIDLASLDFDDLPPVTIQSQPGDAWVANYVRMNEYDPARIPTVSRLLANMGLPAAYASIMENETVIAVGLGVAGQGFVGLFDIVTDPQQRKRGLGKRLVYNLLHWGQTQGATQGFLQVVPQNTPAMRLYESIGFHEAYQYWYRARGE
jgi:ribosomal protein S18 acetylase RimI-like enzyme